MFQRCIGGLRMTLRPFSRAIKGTHLRGMSSASRGAPMSAPQVMKTAGNIYCIGRNYDEHAKELGNVAPKDEPVVFLKSQSALRSVDAGSTAFADEALHHEIELVVRVGETIRMGSSPGWDQVSHVALGLDLTRREKQSQLKNKKLPWALSKSFLGSGVLGTFYPTDAVTVDFNELEFELLVCEESRQYGRASDMIFTVPFLLKFLATYQPLLEGDLVMTGTPAGVGPMRVGDSFQMAWRNGLDGVDAGVL